MKTLALLLSLATLLPAQPHSAIPKTIRIQGKVFTVYVDGHSPEEISSNVGDWGVCNCKKGYIQIDPNQTDEQQRDTLWHEVNHGLNDCDVQFDKYVDYDNLFSDLVPAQLEVLRDNPKLVKFLLAGRKSRNTTENAGKAYAQHRARPQKDSPTTDQ